jgi:hypothetical protein
MSELHSVNSLPSPSDTAATANRAHVINKIESSTPTLCNTIIDSSTSEPILGKRKLPPLACSNLQKPFQAEMTNVEDEASAPLILDHPINDDNFKANAKYCFFQPTNKLWQMLCHQNMVIDESELDHFSLHEAEFVCDATTETWPDYRINDFTYEIFRSLFHPPVCNYCFFKGEHATISSVAVPPSRPFASVFEQNSFDVLWLSPNVFISCHVYTFSSIDQYSYEVELSLQSPKVSAFYFVYFLEEIFPGLYPDEFNPSSFVAVGRFLHHLIAPMPLNYFSRIKLDGPIDASVLRSFLSIIPPNKEPMQQQLVANSKDELTEFLFLGEYEISALQVLTDINLNQYVRLDLRYLRAGKALEELEDTNSILRNMKGVRHLTVPTCMSAFNSQGDSFSCNATLCSLIITVPSLYQEFSISTKMLLGIKQNHGLQSLTLSLYRPGKTTITQTCHQALDGNNSLLSLTLHFHSQASRTKLDSFEHLATELALCKNGWNMRTIFLKLSYWEESYDDSNKVPISSFDRFVAPLLSLNWFCDKKRKITQSRSSALVTRCILAINHAVVISQITNQTVAEQIPSKASLIYDILQNTM